MGYIQQIGTVRAPISTRCAYCHGDGVDMALAQPDRPVLVITGDGEQLMGLGALATIGAQRPANLGIVVLDNGHYGETGMQRSHTALGVDLIGVANATDIPTRADADARYAPISDLDIGRQFALTAVCPI